MSRAGCCTRRRRCPRAPTRRGRGLSERRRQPSLAGRTLTDAPGRRPAAADLVDAGQRHAGDRQEDPRPASIPIRSTAIYAYRRAAAIRPVEDDTRRRAGCPGNDGGRAAHRPRLEDRSSGRQLCDGRRPLFELYANAGSGMPSSSRASGLDQIPESLLPLLACRDPAGIDGRRHRGLRRDCSLSARWCSPASSTLCACATGRINIEADRAADDAT